MRLICISTICLVNEYPQNFKQYLKKLLQDSIPNITFTNPKNRNESEKVCFAGTLSDALGKYHTVSDDFYTIFESSEWVRNDILHQKQWIFEGNFDGFNVPKFLQQMVQWVILGAKHRISDSARDIREMDSTVNNICQIVMKSTKTKRQMMHQPVDSKSTFRSRLHQETPFSIGLGLHIHKETRSEKIIDCLSELKLTINYDKIMKIETEIANATSRNMHQTMVYLYDPLYKEEGKYILLSIILTFITTHQTANLNSTEQGRLSSKYSSKFAIERSPNTSMKFKEKPFEDTIFCNKPTPPNESFPSFIKTKQDLTIYLAEKVKIKFDELGIPYIITYDATSYANISNLQEDLTSHEHEEAVTLLILHTIEIAKRIPFCECVIYSPDTDVFLLLIYYYPSSPMVTKVWTGRGENLRLIDTKKCYESLGSSHVSALLGFHTFTGCDQTGKFNGKSKNACWKVFTKCDNKV